MTAAQIDAQEEVLLTALQDVSREAWKLWGRTAPEPSLDHRVTAHLLEYGMGRGVDGFVSFGGAR